MTRLSGFAAIGAGIIVVFAASPALLQENELVLHGPLKVIPDVGVIARPASSTHSPGIFHTHLQIMIPDHPVTAPPRPGVNVPRSGSSGQTPASLACVYNLVPQSYGCDPYSVSAVANGGSTTNPIVIVDAYNNPTVVKDLQYFSLYFGLPQPTITVYYCNRRACGVSNPPPKNAGWALEQALDVQAAHSMAPNAPIYLVEAYSNSFTDLFNAEIFAASLAAKAGGGEVSNSWGSNEFPTEASYDYIFNQPGVIFFASAGDAPGVQYPSSSPYVVGVGGTTIVLNGGSFYQATWATNSSEAGGGGISAYELLPSYQSAAVGGNRRGVPDLSADANPVSGLWVYCTPSSCGLGLGFFASPWVQVGGASLSSALVAGMTNYAINANANNGAQSSSTSLLGQIYSNLGNGTYYPVTNEDPENSAAFCYNGPNDTAVTSLTPSWNVCTGAGTPQGTPQGLGGL
jgi:subtilase family serine protease